MSVDDQEIIGVSDAAVSEKDWEDQPNCNMNLPVLPAVSEDCVWNAPSTRCWNADKKPNYIWLMWLYLHHCWCRPVVCVSAIFIACVDTLSEFVIQVGEIRARGSCRNSSTMERPADSCGTSSVPWRILPKVLLPTKLWMNSEMKQLWTDF